MFDGVILQAFHHDSNLLVRDLAVERLKDRIEVHLFVVEGNGHRVPARADFDAFERFDMCESRTGFLGSALSDHTRGVKDVGRGSGERGARPRDSQG